MYWGIRDALQEWRVPGFIPGADQNQLRANLKSPWAAFFGQTFENLNHRNYHKVRVSPKFQELIYPNAGEKMFFTGNIIFLTKNNLILVFRFDNVFICLWTRIDIMFKVKISKIVFRSLLLISQRYSHRCRSSKPIVKNCTLFYSILVRFYKQKFIIKKTKK